MRLFHSRTTIYLLAALIMALVFGWIIWHFIATILFAIVGWKAWKIILYRAGYRPRRRPGKSLPEWIAAVSTAWIATQFRGVKVAKREEIETTPQARYRSSQTRKLPF